MSLQEDLFHLFSSVSSVHSRNLKNKSMKAVTPSPATVTDEKGLSAVSSIVSSLVSVTPCPSTATVHPMRENVPDTDSPTQEPPSSNSLSICITGTCSSGKSRSAVPPRDLGTFRTLVSGWETVTSPKDGHALPPNLSSSSLNTNFESHSVKSVTSAAREQFFLPTGDRESQTASPLPDRRSALPSISYRFAGADRLANRAEIYDSDAGRANVVVSNDAPFDREQDVRTL